MSLNELRLRAARARIADVASVLAAPAELGLVHLRPHQRLAVARAADAIARHGGCLLADDVGRGKTFIALAVATRWERPLVVVPASLRLTWQRAMSRARVPCAIVTHEALSRGSLPHAEPDGIIVDESHRFRSLGAKRHAMLARLAAHVPVLLLSATPIQNAVKDLAAQLALFLGSAAFGCDETRLARHVLRSPERADAELPAVAPARWVSSGHDDAAALRAILALPPPARPFDAGDAGALRTIGLVRAWASSRAALTAALRRRVRVATALEQCAASGLAPSRRDLHAWQGMDGDIQLALAPLLVSRAAGPGASTIVAAIAVERLALERLTAALGDAPDPDVARIEALRSLRVQHQGARILAFSEFASTVRAYFALLRADAGVGMLTAREARIASGPLPRDALLERFAPAAQGVPEPALRERVTLLLATDLLSEGVNLQDASVVVHLDLPWNPARLAQRLGRVRRPGGAPVVHSYLMAPPATTELLLRVDERLRAKLVHAERAVGRTLHVLPALSRTPADPGALTRLAAPGATASAEALGDAADTVSRWRLAGAREHPTGARGPRPDAALQPTAGAVACDQTGWLAALDDGRLLARRGAAPPNSTSAVVQAVALASGIARPTTRGEVDSALAEVCDWLERERVTQDCGIAQEVSVLDHSLERWIARAVRRAPRYERACVLLLARRIRAMLGRPRSLGAERELEQLLAAHEQGRLSDRGWLERAAVTVARDEHRATIPPRVRVAAMIVFGPGGCYPG